MLECKLWLTFKVSIYAKEEIILSKYYILSSTYLFKDCPQMSMFFCKQATLVYFHITTFKLSFLPNDTLKLHKYGCLLLNKFFIFLHQTYDSLIHQWV